MQSDSQNNTPANTEQGSGGNVMFKPGNRPNDRYNGTGIDKSEKNKSDWIGLGDSVINEETPFPSEPITKATGKSYFIWL